MHLSPLQLIISRRNTTLHCKSSNMNGLLDKISKEEKTIFLLGDFNINLLNYNEHRLANDFLDSLASSSLLPYKLQPTRLTGHYKTLIDDIFCNLTPHEVVPGIITATISDNLSQFSIAPTLFIILSSYKSRIFKRN